MHWSPEGGEAMVKVKQGINASLRMYKSDWIRMYNFDFNMHTDFEVKWCACKFENHNRD